MNQYFIFIDDQYRPMVVQGTRHNINHSGHIQIFIDDTLIYMAESFLVRKIILTTDIGSKILLNH